MVQIDILMKFLSMEAGVKPPETHSLTEKQRFVRGLLNGRPPIPMPPKIMHIQDSLLHSITDFKGVTKFSSLSPVEEHIYFWKGDITCLAVDAIVNAANNRLLGCYIPCHRCIDNAIHTFAGTQLRIACHEIMEKQGTEEPVGCAKITPGFNLPSKHVIHTVGPIVFGDVTQKHSEDLASCYRSSLELAVENGLKSIAFCCISTGEFHFPKEKAAEIALATVRTFVKEHDIDVVFALYTAEDVQIYKSLQEETEL